MVKDDWPPGVTNQYLTLNFNFENCTWDWSMIVGGQSYFNVHANS